MSDQPICVTPKIEIDYGRRTLAVGEFVYSIEILASGLSTPPGCVVRLTPSERDADGKRSVMVQSWSLDELIPPQELIRG